MIVIGVDLGKHGGLCALDSQAQLLSIGEYLPRILELIPMPEDNRDIIEFLKTYSTVTHKGKVAYESCMLVMEEINVYTNNIININSTSKLLKQHGFFEGVGMSHGIEIHAVHPREWQKKMGCQTLQGKDKITACKGMTLDQAKQHEKDYGTKGLALREAKKRFPGVRLIPDGCRVPHDGIVDSLLLAEYGRVYLI